MSQDISNLCTTEDAFEKFQSVTMHGEEEFIMLSDIVPPQPAAPDLSNELNEIPYDNEVILSSTENDDALHTNTKLLSNDQGNDSQSSKISDNNGEHLSHSDQSYSEAFGKKPKRNRKSGRKNMKLDSQYEKDTLNVSEYHIGAENSAVSDNQAIQDSVLSTTVGKNDNEDKSYSQGDSKYPRRTRRERIPNTSKYPLTSGIETLDTTPSKTTGKRRGRPKKSLDVTSISEPDSTNIDNVLVDENVRCSDSGGPEEFSHQNVNKRGKRGRPKTTQMAHTKLNDSSNNIIENVMDTPIQDLKPPKQKRRKNIDKTNEKLSDDTADKYELNIGTNTHITKTDVHSEEKILSGNELVSEHAPSPNNNDSHITNINQLSLNNQSKTQTSVIKPIVPTSESIEEPIKYTQSMNLDDDDDDDDGDDICLSKLKENINTISENLDFDIQNTDKSEIPSKRNPKVPFMADFEYNIDKIVKEASIDDETKVEQSKESLLVEDISKRPNRRKAKQNFKYHEESDEDPFANVELSDDDEPKNRKKGRYDYDDEYIPGKKKGMLPVTSSSDTDSELNEILGDGRKHKKKKIFKNVDNVSPRKRGRKKIFDDDMSCDIKSEASDIQQGEGKESLELSTTKPADEKLSMKPPAEAWATSNEFENFIAQKIQGTNLKIKKVSTKLKSDSIVAPLEIPVVDQNEPKKMIESSTQTNIIPTTSTSIQTSVPYDIPMKVNINLSSEQSQKACEFLNSVVKTTVELGQLMKDKSEDFMKKKINPESVTDTFKMDYCVRKSFLLFKLAKHNLMQMEEDLAKQYDEFLKSNVLSSCREEIKNITPKAKADSDSDCEIIDVKEIPSTSSKIKAKEKPKFNPKTVFLNKELSIKIAKKPSADKNIDVKGRHTVWINDSVMVKKVMPSQSFLAQDSRNKKPPDCVTEKMVSDFFEDYYRQKALAVCAPYINSEWCRVHKEYACHYFVKCDLDAADSNSSEISMNIIESNASTSNGNLNDIAVLKQTCINNPKSLSALCTEVVHKCFHLNNANSTSGNLKDLTCPLTDGNNKIQPQPLTLFRLCIQTLSTELQKNMSYEPSICHNLKHKINCFTVEPLKTLCYRNILDLMPKLEKLSENFENINEHSLEDNDIDSYGISEEDVSDHWQECDVLSDDNNYCEKDIDHDTVVQGTTSNIHVMKSLHSLCTRSIQINMFGDPNKSIDMFYDMDKLYPKIQAGDVDPLIGSPRSLKYIVFEIIKNLTYPHNLTESLAFNTSICHTEDIFHCNENSEDFTINCINTMSEEAFHSLKETHELQEDADYGYEADDAHFNDDEDDDEGDVSEWASQVQMQVLSSCASPRNNHPTDEIDDRNIINTESVINATDYTFSDTNIQDENQYQSILDTVAENPLLTKHIKLEPLDEESENVVDPSIIKTEPIHGMDGMTIIPESVMTKSEMMESVNETAGLAESQSSAYDVNDFEQFVRTNKMMRSMGECSDEEEIFSQSALRIRRQHEPDYDAGNDMNMSLLVPQTSEPLQLENAKGILMESSSDESRMDSGAKKGNKKKCDRKKGKHKKGKENAKNINSKVPPTLAEIPTPVKEVSAPVKEKYQGVNEVAMLTRRMREKIRQEEKKIESSDSESEKIPLSLKKDKAKKECEKTKPDKKQGESSNDKIIDEIQCSNVDSTNNEQVFEKKNKSGEGDKFTGFSAIDQNEISSYQKYMQFVYDKIIPGVEDSPVQENASNDFDDAKTESNRSSSPVINPDHPVELLECEPTMPIFDNDKGLKRPKRISKKNKVELQNNIEKEGTKCKNNFNAEEPEEIKSKKVDKIEAKKGDPKFKDCDGWHLYSIDATDTKLYQNCLILLEKLPESFVDTYLEYHDITSKDNEDKEVDRLANLLSLNRSTSTKEIKLKDRHKQRKTSSADQMVLEQNCLNGSKLLSLPQSDRYDELTPSEDEGANVDDELPPPVPIRPTENYIAKDSLMNENESDSDGGGIKKIKQEIIESDEGEVKRKPGPKSKTRFKVGTKADTKDKVETSPTSESLMLTADKMMNKELSLLHAPVNLKEEVKDTPVKEPSPKEGTRPKRRSAKVMSLRDRIKTEDDSSSEEEKQWVSTKEKLLKRMGKKEDTSADDAKRAKLVDDFIERRADAPGKRRPHVGGRRQSKKKFLERMKQQRFLSKELFGESSTDVTPGKRGTAAGLFKGRRNIRKVIDKKSLHKSTVLANMEEFERKRRLNARQNQLRELLGCEEGVNVLVINDEVCLEYDFQEQRPVVTVHPFFTKVMKAHQYEGVKFMWDACFESLESIETGRGGGGCILAHCMGLGKTLQVLALLHTVLTHPRVGMQRVLVCCPLSTVLNWVDEIHKWIGPVTDQIKVFELSKLKKTYERAYQLEDWYSGGGIFIIGYELFRSLTTLDPLIDEVRPTIINKIRTALLDPGPDIVICDEGHLLKNDCSVLAVAMSRVVTKRRIILTGTPMQNNLREYYCMVNFVKPSLLGTYSEYSNRFENPIMNGQHRDSREEDIKLMKARTHILHKVLEGCLQRQEASVLYPYLPKKHEYTVFIPLTKCQWDLYKHYVHNYTKKSKQSVLKDFHILQKIWSHPQVLHNFQIKARDDTKKKDIKPEKLEDDLALEDKEDIKPADTEVWWLQYLADGAMLDSLECSNKFVAVFRILHECVALGDKVLIFSTSLFCLDALEYFLRKNDGWSLGQEYFRLDGSVPAEVRQKWCREFNAENNIKTKLFLISTRAGCLGLNMTAANRVIILDTSWNPAHDIQSIFRVYRFGQKKDCYIYRLVAMGTMEQKIYERSVTKQAVACRVVDEQQIDRHYNMAELTELYRFDEHGSGVAGGVAVGVGDVALLRVARDAAVHAVHEHDSLLRGSGEQGLPEHERAAAWMQFQQEHAHKQMQNDLESDQAARALKLLQEQQMLQEQMLLQQQQAQQAQILSIKTEDGPVHENLLVPRPDPPAMRGRAQRGRGRKVVQCRIPIKPDGEIPGPSGQAALDEAEIVQKISDILIKHNFTPTAKKPKQIKDLVAKVKQMIRTGEPLSLACDDLTASIASVLLQQKGTTALVAPSPPSPVPPIPPMPLMPALTDVEEPTSRRTRGRPKKTSQNTVQEEPPPPAPVIQPIEEDTGGRRRRKAALAAERNFDIHMENDACNSQDSIAPNPVIELDDDDWHGGQSDTDSANEINPEPAQVEQQKPLIKPKKEPSDKPKGKLKKRVAADITPKKPDDTSILLSDDEPPQDEMSLPTEEVTPLHPSLLTNQNFIKIVAHTYLAGNSALDEDAATLAARYSTFRLLKEAESTGKAIVNGPIYDIAVKVLGIEVLQKLQSSDPKIKERGESSATSSKMMQLLGANEAVTLTPVPKKKPGPKSRVQQPIKEEQQEMPKLGVPPALPKTNIGAIVPVSLLKRGSAPAPTSAPIPAVEADPSDECILPDDDDVRCLTEPAPAPAPLPPPTPAKPLKIKLRKLTTNADKDIKPTLQEPIRVTAGNVQQAPVSAPPSLAVKQFATICLDSDEEDAPPAPAPAPGPGPRPAARISVRAQRAARLRSALQNPSPISPGAGPVPVALTGPDSQPIPLALSAAPAPAPAPTPAPPSSSHGGYYGIPSSMASSASYSEPIPISLTGPDSRPVPISLTGPDSRPVPISLTGPGFQGVPLSLAGPGPYAVPTSMSFAGSGEPIAVSYSSVDGVPMSFAGSTQSFPLTFTIPSSSGGGGVRPVAMSFVGSQGGAQPMAIPMSAVRMSVGSPAGQQPPAPPGSVAHHLGSNIYLVPAASAGDRLLARVPTSQVPPNLQIQPPTTAAPPPGTPKITIVDPTTKAARTLCKPGDILRLTKTGQLEIVQKNSENVVHTIDDDEPVLNVPKPPTPVVLKPVALQKSSPAIPTSKSSDSKALPSKTSASKALPPKPSDNKAQLSKPAQQTLKPKGDEVEQRSLINTKSKEAGRRTRKASSSSSSSSDSSRSPSPDPLSILKDVVHIQAPERRKKTSKKHDTSASTAQQSISKTTVPKRSLPSNDTARVKDDAISMKLNNILSSVKAKKTSTGSDNPTPSKSAPTVQKSTSSGKLPVPKIKDSIDLTEITFKSMKPNPSKPGPSKPGPSKPGPSKPSPLKTNDILKSNPNIVKSANIPKKDSPVTVVGTSKNIVLDGKSKSLTNKSTVDLTGHKSVQVTNVKTIPPNVNKQKPLEKKRPAPTPEPAPLKKKKTEPMTLKDFDIDDIDDIIELD